MPVSGKLLSENSSFPTSICQSPPSGLCKVLRSSLCDRGDDMHVYVTRAA